MSTIKRYTSIYNNEAALRESADGELCRWSDVEALQKELNEVRAQALAAVWLVPEGWTPQNLKAMREEASEVFMGRDKKRIATLQDELSCAQEAIRHATRQPRPGVNAVYGVNTQYPEVANIRHALMITKLNHAPNGGLEIEVQLP